MAPLGDWSDEGFRESLKLLEETWLSGRYDGLIGVWAAEDCMSRPSKAKQLALKGVLFVFCGWI